MTRTQRLRPVVNHTDKKQQQALQEVAKSQGMLELEQDKLGQLKQYKLEYLHKKQRDIGIYTALELQEFNRFLQQLEETIIRQQDVIQQRAQELEQRRQVWNTTRIDSKVMHKVVDKLERQEIIEADRLEQKELDDITQRRKSSD